MALTLRSSTSFLSPLDPSSKREDAPPCCVVPMPAPGSGGRLRLARAAPVEHATMEEMASPEAATLLHHGGGGGQGQRRGKGTAVYVMLPLETVGAGGKVARARALAASLAALRSGGVEGVMVDVWWGVVEREGPRRYDWEGYGELVRMVERAGLRLQMVMSFHQCGGNVGDSCK
ncbi:Os10g0565200 [Oryza sativa Japonica Group]|uniref:Beta-amylase n=1 Tax=Oryza sativa subsp. japonica TaxID=39947 RepID=A0A0P0XXP5_ORYSJ|nr:hypothetical protein EE612_052833 [Oryza sativa]BAT12103.1 Os10g0565200 [Oryza sativa Japonica Group]